MYVYVCVRVCVYIYIYIYVCAYVCVYEPAYMDFSKVAILVQKPKCFVISQESFTVLLPVVYLGVYMPNVCVMIIYYTTHTSSIQHNNNK